MHIQKFRNKQLEYNLPSGDNYFDNLKKINVFVGSNNSGKSRFLREVFKSEEKDIVRPLDYQRIYTELKNVYKKLHRQYKDLHLMADLKTIVDNGFSSNIYEICKNFILKVEYTKGTRRLSISGISDQQVAIDIYSELKSNGLLSLGSLQKQGQAFVYIPMLRGLRYLNSSDDLYLKKTTTDYEFEKILSTFVNKKIFTGLGLYEEILDMLIGTKKQQNFILEFQDFLSKSFFNNNNIKLSTNRKTHNLQIDIGDGEDFRDIHEVGDGIQSIIIMTFFAFKNPDKDLILFLEEPELAMHPSVQRTLIEVLITKFENLQVFLTTHSNHFLDLTYDYPNDVAIFSFKKDDNEEKFFIENLTDNSKILDLLGVRNSSVFLSNCVIWTEGVTDRMLLRKLLSLDDDFVKKYKEDYHYAFAEYGGGNLENFDFIGESDESYRANIKKAISKKNYIVIDNDKSTSKSKIERRQKIKSFLGETHVFDDHIEIENLIPFNVWEEVLSNIFIDRPGCFIEFKDNYQGNKNRFDKLLSKEKIYILMKENFIKVKNGKKVPDYFSAKSIKCLGLDKKEIMQYVIKAIDDLKLSTSDFPEMTKDIILSIKNFVEESNS